MNVLLLVSLLIGNLQVTSYRSTPNQTDDSPYITSIGEHVSESGVAVSQDLLKQNGGPIEYGDTIYIDNIGFKHVNDCMNIRHHNRIDVWVATKDKEKEFDNKFGKRKLRVWLIKKQTKNIGTTKSVLTKKVI